MAAPVIIPVRLPRKIADLRDLCEEVGIDHDGKKGEDLSAALELRRKRADELAAKTKEALTKEARTVGAAAGGNKVDLVKAILQAEPVDDSKGPADGDGKDGTDHDSLPADDDLEKLSGVQLKDICLKLGLDGKGKKPELLQAIKQKRRLDQGSIKASSADGWREAIMIRQPKVDIEKLPLDWGLPAVLLTPCVWPVLFWREPLSRSDLRGPVGTDGPMVEALMKRWRSLLGCTEKDIQRIKSQWLVMHATIHAERKLTPEEWCRENWTHLVAPVIKGMRHLQADKFEAQGLSKVASRMRGLARAPVEEVGYDCIDLVEKTMTRIGGGGDNLGSDSDDGSVRGGGGGRKRRRNRGGGCFKCGAKPQPKAGQTRKQWYEAHNQVCKN